MDASMFGKSVRELKKRKTKWQWLAKDINWFPPDIFIIKEFGDLIRSVSHLATLTFPR